jgi:thiamine-phosphate pyrophosphorylase
MFPPMRLPRLYPVLDAAHFARASDPQAAILGFAEELMQGGATLIQYRDKTDDLRFALDCARQLREITRGRALLIINDRVDLCLAADADGVHLGQDDLPPEAARRILDAAGGERSQCIGFSTHNPEQAGAAASLPVEYLAIGPVFATSSKANPDPVVGLGGVREARKATRRPLVAIGGITRGNCRSVIEAGADCVAIISDLVESPRAALQEFLNILR